MTGTSRTIPLTGEGFEVLFRLVRYNDELARVAMIANGGGVEVETPEVVERIADLERLCTYLVSHIETLMVDSHKDSDTFITYSLAFQLTALCGHVDHHGGSFSIRFMVRDFDSKVYIGFEGSVDVDCVQTFCEEIMAFVTSNSGE